MLREQDRQIVIYDGDMGGDDAIAIMMMLGHPDRFRVAGITTVLGNVDCEHATRNVLDLLGHFNIRSIPVHQGAARPFYGTPLFGDNAYGDDGIGGVVLRGRGLQAQGNDAAGFIVDTVRSAPEPILIFMTGPQTNLAHALTLDPGIRDNISAVVAFGGGIAPGPHPNVPGRSGNITIHSEFNFFQDPYAANVVLGSGVDIHLMTMDASQNIHLSPSVRRRFADSAAMNSVGAIAAQMLQPAEALDRPKFGVDGPFIHDPNVLIYALQPSLYTGARGIVKVEEQAEETCDFIEKRHGRMDVSWAADGPVTIVNGMADPQEVVGRMADSLRRFSQAFSP